MGVGHPVDLSGTAFPRLQRCLTPACANPKLQGLAQGHCHLQIQITLKAQDSAPTFSLDSFHVFGASQSWTKVVLKGPVWQDTGFYHSTT